MRRRLAAILAADVVGYSRLIRQDESGVLAALRSVRTEHFEPRMHAHHGRIVKLMGDGALVEFASAVEAVAAALEFQRAIVERNEHEPEAHRLVFRIGVNLGDVIIDGEDIQGDGVNVAARLEALAPPGGLAISDGVHEQVRDRAGVAFRDLGERELKNLDRPLRIWEWKLDARPAIEDAGEILWGSFPIPDRPSIAVLPFQNMSGDLEQEYFADGLAEDIITALSRARWLFVIARNSSFTYKGSAVNVRQVGRELGVRHVLEGSVRRSGRRLRVTAQLIDAVTGAHDWAERYDRDLEDIFEVQDEITRNVVASCQTQIKKTASPVPSATARPSLQVWTLTSRALQRIYDLDSAGLSEAARLGAEAVALEPGSAQAHFVCANAHFHIAWMGFAGDRAGTLALARTHAETAVRLERDLETAHWILGLCKMVAREYDSSLASFERALEINPNDSLAYGSLATLLNYIDRPEDSIRNNEIAIRANPRDPSVFFRYTGLALSHVMIGASDEAVIWAKRAVNLKPDWFVGHIALIGALVSADRVDEARASMSDYIRHCPDASIRQAMSLPFRHAASLEVFLRSLRAAGCPE